MDIDAFADFFIEEFNSRGGHNADPFYEQAIYSGMDEVRRLPGVQQLRVGRHDFYYSAVTKLGLFLRVCRYDSVSRNTINRRTHPHDTANGLLACSIDDTIAVCGALLNLHPDSTFVCAIGNRAHEQAMFIKRQNGAMKKDVRIFNCNTYEQKFVKLL